MRKSIWLLAVPLFVLLAQACSSDPVAATAECSDDTDCSDNDVCSSKGQCIPFKNGSSGSGSGTGGNGSGSTTTSTGSGVTSQAACQDYLDCLAVVDPGSVATALPTYGSEGSCWSADAQTAATCATACREGMKGYHDYAPAECPECYETADCSLGECKDGGCVVDLPLPDGSAACTTCRDEAASGSCAYYAEDCAQNVDCVAMATCAATCADNECLYNCANANPSGAETYLYGFMGCVMCEYCYEECNGAMWCQFGG